MGVERDSRRKAILIGLGVLLGGAEVWLGWSVLSQNFLGAFLIFVGLGYCLGGGIWLALAPRGAGPRNTAPRRADRSLLGFAPATIMFLLVMPLEYRFLPALLPRARGMQWLGLGLIMLGMALRTWSRVSLKAAYQGNLQVQSDQRLVTAGAYRRIRHPGYLAFIVLALGLAVGFSSLSGLLGVVLLVGALQYRIRAEEAMLVQAFGQEYTDYVMRTHRLIPGVW